jgi:chemotaxis protein CheD
MSHFVLPHGGPSPSARLRHGDASTVELVTRMEERGARRVDLVAKVFGGARMFAASERDLGGHNAEVALETLGTLRIPVVAKDIGGCRGRKLVFRVEDGNAWVKLL